jgi:hypothetical protein
MTLYKTNIAAESESPTRLLNPIGDILYPTGGRCELRNFRNDLDSLLFQELSACQVPKHVYTQSGGLKCTSWMCLLYRVS